MFVRLTAAIAAACLVSGAALAQGAAKPTDPQIAHVAYTAGVIDITAAKQAIAKSKNKEVVAFAKDMLRDHACILGRRDMCERDAEVVTAEARDCILGAHAGAKTFAGALE